MAINHAFFFQFSSKSGKSCHLMDLIDICQFHELNYLTI
jgi:hypothetical protein